MRLGIFGGTFDPVHLAHLVLAEQCREQARLDQVLFIPAARPPHKQEQPLTPFAHRVEMLTLALSGHPAFQVDEMEKDRPGPSYTVDTLQELQQRHPDAELFLMIGADSLHDLPLWYQPTRILELATLLVAGRPDWPTVPAAHLHRSLNLPENFPIRMLMADVPLIALSSRDLRHRLSEGRSVRYLIPRAVEAYIEDKGLYRVPPPGRASTSA